MKMKNKAVIKFLVIVVVAGLIGGIIGFFSGQFSSSVAWLLTKAKALLLGTSPYALIILNLVGLGTALAYFYKANTLYKELQGKGEENEDAYNAIERMADLSVSFSSVGFIVNILWFSFVSLAILSHYITITEFVIGLLAFVGFGFCCIFLQRSVIHFMKKVSPEKRGEVLEKNFQKDWLESCDEQERMAVYKASFHVYRTSTYTFLILFLVLVFASLVVDIGVAPFLVLGVIWLSQAIIYMKESIRH